jgi:regulatory protein
MGGRTLPGLTFQWGSGPDEWILPTKDDADHDRNDELCREAMTKAGRILARRAHTEKELRDKLGSDLNEAVGDAVVARLKDLGLVNDENFARQWVEERASRRGKAALADELSRKGVDEGVIDEVLGRVPAENEEARAHDLAAKHLDKVAGRSLDRQAALIVGMLLRRGFEPEVAEAATRAVLPPEGWD